MNDLHAAKCAAAPYSTSHQLEWTGRDFLTCARNTNDDGFAPTFVTAFQRLAHHVHVADTFEREVDAAVSHLDDNVLNRLIEFLWVDAVGRTQLLRQFEFLLIDIDTNNTARANHSSADDRGQADTTQTKDGNGVAFFTLAVFMTAPIPVVTPQPSRQISSNGASLLTFANEISGSTVYSEKVEQPM